MPASFQPLLVRKVISLRQVVRSDRNCGGGWELYATTDAKYDKVTSTVLIALDSVVQPVDSAPGVDGFRQPWLPAKEVVKRRVPLREARAVAREVFLRWVRKVQRTVPADTTRIATKQESEHDS